MSENIVQPPYRRQASLAKASDIITNHRPLLHAAHPTVARVTSIDRQNGLVSVTNNQDTNNPNSTQIRNTAQHIHIPIKNYGVNSDGNWFGTMPSINIGDRVILGYLNGTTTNPIILGKVPDTSAMQHLTPVSKDETDQVDPSNLDDFNSQKEVLPSQQVELKKGEGDYERSFNGNSFMAMIDPGQHYDEDTYTQPWRHDFYTGTSDNDYGDSLDCFTDQSDSSQYQIQKQKAQDWVFVHQSNTDDDHHITKKLIKQNGDVHKFLGNKMFQNDTLTSDASADNGYQIKRSYGFNNAFSSDTVKQLLSYAQKQVGTHQVGKLSMYDKNTPTHSVAIHPFCNQTTEDSDQDGSNYQHRTDIEYMPDIGAANEATFIWSLWHENGIQTPDDPWVSTNQIVLDDNVSVTDTPKAGDVVVYELPYKEWGSPVYLMPTMLMEDYKGPTTKVIGEFRGLGHTAIVPMTEVYPNHSDITFVQDHNVPVESSTNFNIDNSNQASLTVNDSEIANDNDQNGFHVDSGSLAENALDNAINMDKNGTKISNNTNTVTMDKKGITKSNFKNNIKLDKHGEHKKFDYHLKTDINTKKKSIDLSYTVKKSKKHPNPINNNIHLDNNQINLGAFNHNVHLDNKQIDMNAYHHHVHMDKNKVKMSAFGNYIQIDKNGVTLKGHLHNARVAEKGRQIKQLQQKLNDMSNELSSFEQNASQAQQNADNEIQQLQQANNNQKQK